MKNKKTADADTPTDLHNPNDQERIYEKYTMNLNELQSKWDEEIPDASDYVPDDEQFEIWEPEYEIDWRDFL